MIKNIVKILHARLLLIVSGCKNCDKVVQEPTSLEFIKVDKENRKNFARASFTKACAKLILSVGFDTLNKSLVMFISYRKPPTSYPKMSVVSLIDGRVMLRHEQAD